MTETERPLGNDRVLGQSETSQGHCETGALLAERGQERQELLLREMNHRVKNLFAVASGVVALSSRSTSDAKELAKTVQARLAALSRAHELILPPSGAGSGTNLADLARTILAPYESAAHEVVIEGPQIACGPAASTSFALLLHEFATNAVKYGALAYVGGRLRLCWTVSDAELALRWYEENLPVDIVAPDGKGFGSFLVDATMRTLSAHLDRDWSRGTLIINLRVPLERLGA